MRIDEDDEIDEEGEVMVCMPTWAWNILIETLEMDSVSGAFDRALRQDILRALDAIEEVYTD
jgi:hypothetical protein